MKVTERDASGKCMFCGTLLDAEVSGGGDRLALVSRVASASRSGLIAAALLGVGTFGACVSGNAPSGDVSVSDRE